MVLADPSHDISYIAVLGPHYKIKIFIIFFTSTPPRIIKSTLYKMGLGQSSLKVEQFQMVCFRFGPWFCRSVSCGWRGALGLLFGHVFWVWREKRLDTSFPKELARDGMLWWETRIYNYKIRGRNPFWLIPRGIFMMINDCYATYHDCNHAFFHLWEGHINPQMLWS